MDAHLLQDPGGAESAYKAHPPLAFSTRPAWSSVLPRHVYCLLLTVYTGSCHSLLGSWFEDVLEVSIAVYRRK